MIAFDELIKLGVRKLRKFGYTHVNKQNILTDEVYRIFFERILKERLEKNKKEREDISHLLEKISLNSSNILPQ
ncbi:MAG: hypothetical protein RIC35_10095 [Marinoscillum sp.]